MADFEQQLRKHYGGEKLPEDRARAVLAAGRAAAAARARGRRTRWWLSAAAAAIVAVGIVGGVAKFGGKTPAGDSRRIAAQDAAAAVVSYFSLPDYQLPLVSADRAVLEKWLREHGGPANLAVPAAMAGLPTFGCQVLDVRGQKIFLICFFLDTTPADLAASGGMPIKKEMVVTAPDGTMMKKNRPLVHLVVASRAAFRDAPKAGERVRFAAAGEWNFETWVQADLVYLVAAVAPGERLAKLARPL